MNLNIALAPGCLFSFFMHVFVGKVLSRDLTQQLNNAIQFLVHCRPLSVSMGNAIKYVKLQASLLLLFPKQSQSVTHLKGRGYTASTSTCCAAAKTMCVMKPFLSCWVLLEACIFSLCHGLWCKHGFTRVYA